MPTASVAASILTSELSSRNHAWIVSRIPSDGPALSFWRPSQEWNIWMLAFLPTRTVYSVERLAHGFVSSGLFICAGGILYGID
jgi:hypothetical protein